MVTRKLRESSTIHHLPGISLLDDQSSPPARDAGHIERSRGADERLGQRYVQYVTRTYRRRGTLCEGRFRSCLTQEEDDVLGCYRYIELSPVRANMAKHPAEYPWSSYRANARGEPSTLLTHHPLYTALGSDDEARRAAYRELFRCHLHSGIVDEIRAATAGNYVLGSSQFQSQVAAALGRRVPPKKSEPPRKREEPPSPELFSGS